MDLSPLLCYPVLLALHYSIYCFWKTRIRVRSCHSVHAYVGVQGYTALIRARRQALWVFNSFPLVSLLEYLSVVYSRFIRGISLHSYTSSFSTACISDVLVFGSLSILLFEAAWRLQFWWFYPLALYIPLQHSLNRCVSVLMHLEKNSYLKF